jgi:DNA-directed RNA polymerase subunit L
MSFQPPGDFGSLPYEKVPKLSKVEQRDPHHPGIRVLLVNLSQEDTTVGGIVVHCLLKHPHVMSATWDQGDPNEHKLQLRIQTKNNYDPSRAWHEAMVHTKKQLQSLISQLQNTK